MKEQDHLDTFNIALKRGAGDNIPIDIVITGIAAPQSLEIRLGLTSRDMEEYANQPKDYGIRLGKALFVDKLRERFKIATKDGTKLVRIMLDVDESLENAYRWEYLCAPFDTASDSWDYLAAREPYSRVVLGERGGQEFPTLSWRDLRALVVVASPTNSISPNNNPKVRLEPFDVTKAVQNVKNALDGIDSHVLASIVGASGPPTIQALAEEIKNHKFTILHIICHGYHDSEKNKTFLYLEGNNGDANMDEIEAADLIEALRPFGSHLPYLIFLASCQSAVGSREGSLGVLAKDLMNNLNIRDVLAMADQVTMKMVGNLTSTFYKELQDGGWVDIALQKACERFTERKDALVPVLFSRQPDRKFLDKNIEPTELLPPEPIRAGIEKLESLLREQAPILLTDQFKSLVTTLGALASTKTVLSDQANDEALGAQKKINDICKEVAEISFYDLAYGETPPDFHVKCPFPGADDDNQEDYFTFEDAPFFKWPVDQISKFVDLLEVNNFLAVVGPSGCGKSSLVLAGILPQLKSKYRNFRYAYMRISPDPIIALKQQLDAWANDKKDSAADEPPGNVSDQTTNFTADDDADRALGIIPVQHASTSTPHSANILTETVSAQSIDLGGSANFKSVLIVDQFEELFTLCPQEDKRKDFINLLLDVPDDTLVILTLRSDYVNECNKLSKRIMGYQENLEPLAPEALKLSIQHQVEEGHLKFDDDLKDLIVEIVDEANKEPGMMALVQLAMRELWRRRHGRQLLAAEYSDMGGMQKLISTQAHRFYVNQLTKTEKKWVLAIFTRLIALSDQPDSSGSYDDNPRWRNIVWLVPKGADPLGIKALVARLAGSGARLVVTSTKSNLKGQQPISIVDMATKWLITKWDVVAGSLKEDRPNLLLRQQIAKEAREWEDKNEHSSLLLRQGENLDQSQELLQNKDNDALLNEIETRYLQACQTYEREQSRKLEAYQAMKIDQTRKQRNQARIFGLLGVLLVLLVAITASALLLAHDAATHGLAAQTLAQANSQYDLSLLLGVEGTIFNDTSETEGSLFTSLEHSPNIVTTFKGQGALAFSPDGQQVAVADLNNAIQLYDVGTHRPIGKPFPGLTQAITALAFSPKGDILASASKDLTIQLWDLQKHQQRGASFGADAFVSLAFSPDGQVLASATRSGYARLWNVASRDELAPPLVDYEAQSDGSYIAPLQAVSFSHDGKTLALAGDNRRISLWNISNDRVVGLRGRLRGHSSIVSSVAFSPDDHELVSGSWDKTIRIWNVSTFQPIVGHSYVGVLDKVFSVDFSSDGKTIASASNDGTVALWDASTLQPLSPPFVGHNSPVTIVKFNRDGNYLASGGQGQSIILWKTTAQPTLGTAFKKDLGGYTRSVAYRPPNGDLLATGGDDGFIRLWDPSTNPPLALISSLDMQGGLVGQVTFSPDGRYLAAAAAYWNNSTKTYYGKVLIWDMSVSPPQQISSQPSVVDTSSQFNFVVYTSDGKTLAFVGPNNSIILWNQTTRTIQGTLYGPTTKVRSLAASTTGSLLAAGTDNNELFVWDVDTQMLLGPSLNPETHLATGGVTFSHDGQLLADGKGIVLWDVSRRPPQPLNAPLIPGDALTSLAFSHDDHLLAAGDFNQYVLLYDVAAKRQFGQLLLGHNAPVYGVSFSPEGNTLASVGEDQQIILWDLSPTSWRDRACSIANRNLTYNEWKTYVPFTNLPFPLSIFNQQYKPICPNLPFETEQSPSTTIMGGS